MKTTYGYGALFDFRWMEFDERQALRMVQETMKSTMTINNNLRVKTD